MQVGEASPVCMIQRKNAFFKAIKATKSRSAFSWKKKTDKSFHVLLKINQRNFLFNQSLLCFSAIDGRFYLIFICMYVKNIRYLQPILTITW